MIIILLTTTNDLIVRQSMLKTQNEFLTVLRLCQIGFQRIKRTRAKRPRLLRISSPPFFLLTQLTLYKFVFVTFCSAVAEKARELKLFDNLKKKVLVLKQSSLNWIKSDKVLKKLKIYQNRSYKVFKQYKHKKKF